MRKLLVALLTALLATVAFASTQGDCEVKATEQKLEGAAKAKYVASCVKEAKKASAKAKAEAKKASAKAKKEAKIAETKKKCEANAAKKKLEGTKKDAYVEKCVNRRAMLKAADRD